MPYELEAKVWLKNNATVKDVTQKLKKTAQFLKAEKKTDLYFSAPQQKSIIRLREISGKFLVTVKQKKIQQRIEISAEKTFQVDNKTAFLFFCKQLGLTFFSQKTKHSQLFTQEGFQLELNQIAKLGWFLEIEKICHTKKTVVSTQKQLRQIFQYYGFTQKDFEAKTYQELLGKGSL